MRKEKKRRGHTLIVMLLLAIILLLAAISCALSLRLYKRSDPNLSGRWQMELDVTDQACMRANAWLHEAGHGSEVDVGNYMPELHILVELALREDGSWSRQLDEASLSAARQKAEAALHDALRELVRLRIADAGRPLETDTALDARLADAAGMPVERYLSEYGPALLPSAEELQARYNGSGGFQIEGVHIHFDGQDSARYLADDALLVLAYVDRTEVYRHA